MRFSSPKTAALLACLAAPALHAQASPLGPGSVSPAAVVARTDRFDLFWDEEAEPGGEYVLETRLAEVDGRPAVVRRETMSMEGEVMYADSFALDRATLAPLLLRSGGLDGGVQLDFAAGRVRGWIDFEDGRQKVDVRLAEPAFLAGSMDLVLGALPLEAGYEAELALYEPGVGRQTGRVSVTGPEEVRTAGGPLRAWRVEVRGAGSAGTYWLREGSHVLVQFVAADRSMRMVRRGASTQRSDTR
jgi:hypothetical protein